MDTLFVQLPTEFHPFDCGGHRLNPHHLLLEIVNRFCLYIYSSYFGEHQIWKYAPSFNQVIFFPFYTLHIRNKETLPT